MPWDIGRLTRRQFDAFCRRIDYLVEQSQNSNG